jgi:hypothetical protein
VVVAVEWGDGDGDGDPICSRKWGTGRLENRRAMAESLCSAT